MFSMNKKGQSPSELAWSTVYTFAIIILILALFGSLYAMMHTFKTIRYSASEELMNEVISQRFTSSPHCFTKFDPETGRYYPGVINLNKFNSDQLKECFFTEGTTTPVRLTLLDKKNNTVDQIFNSDFEKSTGKSGKETTIEKLVLMDYQNKLEPARLQIEVKT